MKPTELTEKRLKEIESIIINKTSHVINMDADVKLTGITGYLARQIDGEEIDYLIHAESEFNQLKRELFNMSHKEEGKKVLNEGVWDALMICDEFEEKYFNEEE